MGLAAATIGAGVLSAGASMIGSQSAASAQKDAADQASATQRDMFNKLQTNLQPYMTAGQGGLNQLTDLVTGDPQKALEATPGYQFTRTQGLKAVQNSAAARGLGISGAAMKGAANFATGLADNTYNQRVGNALQLANIGQTSAAGVGNAGIATGNSIANNLIGAGNAQGAANIATGNAVGGLGNSALSAYLTPQLLGGGGLYGSSGNLAGMTNAQQDAYQDAGGVFPAGW